MMAVLPLPTPVLYLLQCLQTGLVICTTPKGSFFRVVYSLWLVFTTYQYYLKANEYCADCIQKLHFVLYSFVQTIHCVNLLLIIGLDRETVACRRQPNDHAGVFWRIWSAVEMTFNPRGINTAWQIRNIPPFSSFLGSKPGRVKFLLRQVAVFAWQYLVLDVLVHVAHSYWDENGKNKSHLDVPDGPLSIQMTIQMVASFFVTRLALDLIHRALSIVFVSIHLSAPQDWPPLFGSMWDSYTLRMFWGKFWHQLLRWPFATLCSFTAHSILPFGQPSKYQRYLTVVFVFTLSGLLHQIGSYSLGISLGVSDAFSFFGITTLGVFIEEAFLKSSRKPASGAPQQGKEHKDKEQQSISVALLKRLVGYIWVLAWLGTSGSFLIYPVVSVAIVNRSVGVPYSAVEGFGLQGTVAAIGVSGLMLKVFFKTSL